MKTFQQFILEAYDKDVIGRSQITRTGEGGRIYPERKTGAQTMRTKAVGGGKTEPAKTYKTRKDAGVSNPKRSPAGRQQQPTRERGSSTLSAKEAQRKAYLERKKRESATKDEVSGKDKRIDLKKSADKLLSKKEAPKADPKYKPTGKQTYGGPSKKVYTQKERQSLTRKGEKKLRDLRLTATGKTKESELKHPITHKEVARRKKEK